MKQPSLQSELPVAVDAMGGDRAPDVVVEAAIRACRAGLGPITLVGDHGRVTQCLERMGGMDLAIEVVHASETILMGESPGRAARRKRDSSMHGCFRLVADGKACAALSAGNSGAFLAVGLLTVRRIKNCDRPCLVTTLPTHPRPTVLLDVGANVEVRAAHLAQFGLMGACYAQIQHGADYPKVALLSNGTEASKGTETIREAHRLLNATPINYIGYVEGRQLPTGCADVVVTDGLTGNIVLKLCEGLVGTLFDRIKDTLKGRWSSLLIGPLLKGPLSGLRSQLDWEAVGGAPILGLDAVALVSHGQSSPKALVNAIRNARLVSERRLVASLDHILQNHAPGAATSTSELPISSTGELVADSDESTA